MQGMEEKLGIKVGKGKVDPEVLRLLTACCRGAYYRGQER